jgi:hypothetical protein
MCHDERLDRATISEEFLCEDVRTKWRLLGHERVAPPTPRTRFIAPAGVVRGCCPEKIGQQSILNTPFSCRVVRLRRMTFHVSGLYGNLLPQSQYGSVSEGK